MSELPLVSSDVSLDDLRRAPNALAGHYSRFQVADRLLLTGHSHQAWPDVAREALLAAFDDAACCVERKWPHQQARADAVVAGFRRLLGELDARIALGANTHELVIRFLSGLELPRRPRLITTDGEFHTVRRQLSRLAEEGIDVVRVAADPVDTLAERVAAEVDDATAGVLVSLVLFETARIVNGLDGLAAACARHGAELLVDAYHALGVIPVSLAELGLADAWVVGGGYKYLQLGEGNCFLRLPPHADWFRPVVTGWYAEFDAVPDPLDRSRVAYADGGARFDGATYDPTSHYRGARVFEFFRSHGLNPEFLRAVSQHQVGLLAEAFDALDAPPDVIDRDRRTPLAGYGGFLALRCADAAGLRTALAVRGVHCDARAAYLRFGPAPYLTDRQLRDTIAALGEVLGPAPGSTWGPRDHP